MGQNPELLQQVNSQTKDLNDVLSLCNFPPEEVCIGPNSPDVYTILNEWCYDGSIRFTMEYTNELGGPHCKYKLTNRGKILAEKIEEKTPSVVKESLKALADSYSKMQTESICRATLEHFTRQYPMKGERIINPIELSSVSVLFAPIRLEKLRSQASKLEENLEEFHYECELGDVKANDSHNYIPIYIKVKDNEFYKDLGNLIHEPGLSDLIEKSCDGAYIAYLYEDSTFLTYYSHPSFEVKQPNELTTTRHFRNICKRVLTNIHLTTYVIVNPKFASLIGSADFSYWER